MAGFTNSSKGFWTYNEIDEGDFLSFLYGARSWNLYRVSRKFALDNASLLPPWPPVTFRISGKTYYFPFRLQLQPVRTFQESLVRPEFSYVAENLLLRGGYRRTHFQADQTTLQAASQMGCLYIDGVDVLLGSFEEFTPLITFQRSDANPPSAYQFSELVLQALLKRYLRKSSNLELFLEDVVPQKDHLPDMEVLGELALPEGQVDILVKESTPIGVSTKIVVEVKSGAASASDIDQLVNYIAVVGPECKGGVLVARSASASVASYAREKGVHFRFYDFDPNPRAGRVTFGELLTYLKVSRP